MKLALDTEALKSLDRPELVIAVQDGYSGKLLLGPSSLSHFEGTGGLVPTDRLALNTVGILSLSYQL
jgi:hypothetical protein